MRNLNAVVKQLNNSTANACASFVSEAEKQLVGKDCLIIKGKYRGRKAKVESVIISHNMDGYGLGVMARPYKLTKQGEIIADDLLWDDREARSWRPISDMVFDVV